MRKTTHRISLIAAALALGPVASCLSAQAQEATKESPALAPETAASDALAFGVFAAPTIALNSPDKTHDTTLLGVTLGGDITLRRRHRFALEASFLTGDYSRRIGHIGTAAMLPDHSCCESPADYVSMPESTPGELHEFKHTTDQFALSLSYNYAIFLDDARTVQLRGGPSLGLLFASHKIRRHDQVPCDTHADMWEHTRTSTSKNTFGVTAGLNVGIAWEFLPTWTIAAQYHFFVAESQTLERGFTTGLNTNHQALLSISKRF